MRLLTAPSIFTYSVTRPFPSRWFTVIVLSSGIVLAILFTFIAVASNAYELDSVYTTDPDGIENDRGWFQKKPFSWFNSLESQCQSTLITVGALYKTTNRGFVYTLSSMRNESGLVPVAAYTKAPLLDCKVVEISITLARMDNTRLSKNYWAWGASTAAATINCSSDPEPGPLHFEFSTALPAVGVHGTGSLKSLSDSFRYQNDSGNVDMWYGMQLTSAWYGKLPIAMGYSTPQGEASWGTGIVPLTRNVNTSDYTRPEFFNCGASFSTDEAGLNWMPGNETIADWRNQHHDLPNISISIDAFGKSFYSLLLSDFGVQDETNALASAAGIQYLQTRNDTDLIAAALALDEQEPGTVHHVLDIDNVQDPVPNWPSTTSLFTQYLCSVPRRKGGMSLLIPVFIADIVFLQACWKFSSLVATWWLGKKHPRMNYCEGCAASNQEDVITLEEGSSRPLTTRSYSGYQASDTQELLPV